VCTRSKPILKRASETRGVSHYGLGIYIKKYLMAKEELWKFKYLQKYNLQKNPLKQTKILQDIITL
jgi:uncharacterized HAD superfamily protein